MDANEEKKKECIDVVGELEKLADRVLHREKPPEIVKLSQILDAAKEFEPADKRAFVRYVNTVLKGLGYRIRLPNGRLCLLCFKSERKDEIGYVLFQTRGGALGGFKTTMLDFEPVAYPYRGAGGTEFDL